MDDAEDHYEEKPKQGEKHESRGFLSAPTAGQKALLVILGIIFGATGTILFLREGLGVHNEALEKVASAVVTGIAAGIVLKGKKKPEPK